MPFMDKSFQVLYISKKHKIRKRKNE